GRARSDKPCYGRRPDRDAPLAAFDCNGHEYFRSLWIEPSKGAAAEKAIGIWSDGLEICLLRRCETPGASPAETVCGGDPLRSLLCELAGGLLRVVQIHDLDHLALALNEL